jgi:hypothetical protein
LSSSSADLALGQAYENMQDTFQKNPDMLAAIYYWLVVIMI